MMPGFRELKGCLKEKAFRPENSRGRKSPENDGDRPYFGSIDPFRLDRFKISASKSRRRLARKCQVFCDPENPHVRTRDIHTNEVVMFASLNAEILGLNANLAEAIAEGHDIGHTPLGHFGEHFLTRKTGRKFSHAVMGVVVAQFIERNGRGLDLSYETLEGILYHSGNSPKDLVEKGLPLEYGVVKVADRIAYTFSDINDAARFNVIRKSDIKPVLLELGQNQREQTLNCLLALARESNELGTLSFEHSTEARKFGILRQWMFDEIYPKLNPYLSIHEEVLNLTYEYFSSDEEFQGTDPAILIALMTDHEINEMARIFLQTKSPKIENLSHFGFMEILPYIKKPIDFTDPALAW